jgi:hypothetical protein
MGDAWIFLATDAESKLMPSFAVGKRDLPTAGGYCRNSAGKSQNAKTNLANTKRTNGLAFAARY